MTEQGSRGNIELVSIRQLGDTNNPSSPGGNVYLPDVEVANLSVHGNPCAGNMKLYDTKGFADPDQPLSTLDKVNLGVLLTFLYSTFIVAVALTYHYN